MLDCLETALSGGTSGYLVGDSPTLADIFVAIVVSRGLEWVLGAPWRAQHPNCMRHFDLITKWQPVRDIVPEFKLIEKETPNVNPYAG
jgi:elongation factor 1-gamma